MDNMITEDSLIDKLEDIRGCIRKISRYDMKNTVFMNLDSFLNYIYVKSGRTICLKSLLDEVSPYIPLMISDEHLELFCEAAYDGDGALIDTLEDIFMRNSVARFINSVYDARSDEAWDKLVGVCTSIWEYRQA